MFSSDIFVWLVLKLKVWLKGICLIYVCCRKGVGVMQIDIVIDLS